MGQTPCVIGGFFGTQGVWNDVLHDLLDLEDLGALQVLLSQLASYLAAHSNLSQSYETLYRQLKKYRQERS